jgi:signal transduction histidine kinase
MPDLGSTVEVELAAAILDQRRLAYAIADPTLAVHTLGGHTDLLLADGAPLPTDLLTLVPELIEADRVAEAVLAGLLPRFGLELANREGPDGTTVYLDLSLLPWRDAEGQIGGIILLAEDATARGLHEQRITQQHNEMQLLRDQLARQNLDLGVAVAELRRLDDVKSLFLSVAAHELRSPLASMLAYLEIVLDGEFGALTDPQQRAVAVVQNSAERLLKITNDLLDVTRIEAGYMEVVLQPTDLVQLVHRVIAEFRLRIESRGQSVQLDCTAGLPLALCDPARCTQIVANLLDNAHKYSPEGGRIHVSLDRAGDDGFLRIAVADQGAGIDLGDQSRLFERFFRSAHGIEPGTAGAGLGLYITRSLVELHGGRIWFESCPGEGSTFQVTLPEDDSAT